MMEQTYISNAVIKRLPRYYRYLTELEQDEKIERISSGELSRRMGVTASQIRQDLNNFGGFGQQGYGYNVSYLRKEIAKILGLETRHNVLIMGGGNLGRALGGYSGFADKNFVITGIFDTNAHVIGTYVNGIEVMPADKVTDFCAENKVDIAVLAIPKHHAEETASTLYSCGIRAFWNFSCTDLHLPEDCFVEDVNLSESLMTLSYRLSYMPE